MLSSRLPLPLRFFASDQQIFKMAEFLTLAAIQAAIAKYGPIVQIHPDKKCNMCSVEWFLTHCTLVDSKAPTNNIIHPLETQLRHGPKDGTRYYLNIQDSVKPGNISTVKAYVNALVSLKYLKLSP